MTKQGRQDGKFIPAETQAILRAEVERTSWDWVRWNLSEYVTESTFWRACNGRSVSPVAYDACVELAQKLRQRQ